MPSATYIVRTSKAEIELIREFAIEIDASLSKKASKGLSTEFTPKEREELKRLSAAIVSAARSAEGSRAPHRTTMTVSERVGTFAMQVAIPIKQRSFLADMALVYLVSHLEAFIKDYLLYVLMMRPEMLRTGATITFEQLSSFRTMKALWRGAAQREVDDLGYGSIDDVASYFTRKLNIDLSTFPKWQEVREHTFRRNIILHNQGRVNETYRRKTNYATHRDHLHSDMKYLASAVLNILSFIDFIHGSVSKKLKRRRANRTSD